MPPAWHIPRVIVCTPIEIGALSLPIEVQPVVSAAVSCFIRAQRQSGWTGKANLFAGAPHFVAQLVAGGAPFHGLTTIVRLQPRGTIVRCVVGADIGFARCRNATRVGDAILVIFCCRVGIRYVVANRCASAARQAIAVIIASA